MDNSDKIIKNSSLKNLDISPCIPLKELEGRCLQGRVDKYNLTLGLFLISIAYQIDYCYTVYDGDTKNLSGRVQWKIDLN